MTTIVRRGRLPILTVLLAVVLSSLITVSSVQTARAQEGGEGCGAQTPAWVRDRQQYEINYVYVPATAAARQVPQWAKDRQQYETNYVYRPPSSATQPGRMVTSIPQWAKDRQQYETTYVYRPPAGDLLVSASRC